MRRTLWVVSADDLPIIQSAASDRVAANEHRRLVADLAQGGHRRLTANSGWRRHGPPSWTTWRGTGRCSSTELRAALPEIGGTYDPAPGKPWGGLVPVAPRVLTVLSARGSNPARAQRRQLDHVTAPVGADRGLAGARFPRQPTPFAVLVRRWLRTFGPATADDVKWWFGSTLTATRKALGDIGAVEVDLDSGPGYALPTTWKPNRRSPPVAALLPGLDVTTMGWFDRDWYLGEHRGQVFDRNGNAGPTAWWNGRMVGGWYQDDAGARAGATPGGPRTRRPTSVDAHAPPN